MSIKNILSSLKDTDSKTEEVSIFDSSDEYHDHDYDDVFAADGVGTVRNSLFGSSSSFFSASNKDSRDARQILGLPEESNDFGSDGRSIYDY